MKTRPVSTYACLKALLLRQKKRGHGPVRYSMKMTDIERVTDSELVKGNIPLATLIGGKDVSERISLIYGLMVQYARKQDTKSTFAYMNLLWSAVVEYGVIKDKEIVSETLKVHLGKKPAPGEKREVTFDIIMGNAHAGVVEETLARYGNLMITFLSAISIKVQPTDKINTEIVERIVFELLFFTHLVSDATAMTFFMALMDWLCAGIIDIDHPEPRKLIAETLRRSLKESSAVTKEKHGLEKNLLAYLRSFQTLKQLSSTFEIRNEILEVILVALTKTPFLGQMYEATMAWIDAEKGDPDAKVPAIIGSTA